MSSIAPMASRPRAIRYRVPAMCASTEHIQRPHMIINAMVIMIALQHHNIRFILSLLKSVSYPIQEMSSVVCGASHPPQPA